VSGNLGMLVQVVALVGILLGLYFFLEEQVDAVLGGKRSRKNAGQPGQPRFLRSVTGANLENQLIEVMLMISSCLKAGRNLDQAFELVAISSPPPICNEFRTLVQERRLGVPMVDALTNLTARVPSQDLRLAVNATIFQQETGGSLEDLYHQIVVTITERKKVFGKIVAGTAHARLSGSLVGILPIFLAVALGLFQPGYLFPMLVHPFGQIALIASLMASIIGLAFINRMTSGIVLEMDEASRVQKERRKRGWLVFIFTPLTKVLGKINEAVGGPRMNRYREEVKYLLESAGSPWDMSVDEFIGMKEVSGVLFVLLIYFFLIPADYRFFGVLLLVLLFPIGYHLPRIYITRLIKQRQQRIEFELPYMIDLLSLAIEAGLDLVGGIQKIVEKSRQTEAIVEFQMFLADVKMGKSLEEALSEMAERVQILSFFSFVSSLIQAQRLGAEIGPTLRSQAEQMRYQRMILAEEKVNQLPVKLLVPLVFFIFPAISVLLIGPAILKLTTALPMVSGKM